jgi:nicotinic acid mononucleotide adenylyltransferase/nicotinamide mononucleotide (NMN) deamidase PncC
MNSNSIFIDSGHKFVLAISGGGQEIIGNLTRHGGMSACLLEAIVPYSPPAFYKLVGGKPDQIVSPEAARAAAMACYLRGVDYDCTGKVFGLAATSALVKPDGEREGRKHRICMAIQDWQRTLDVQVVLGDTGRDREDEEFVASRCIREALKWGCYIFGDVQRQLTDKDEVFVKSATASAELSELVHKRTNLWWSNNYRGEGRAIFPSSCNPIHEGHLAIIRDAAQRLGCQVDVELCIRNADKPPLDYLTIEDRTHRFLGLYKTESTIGGFVLTNKPLFFDKAKLFPGATFIIGADTLDRILDPKYYVRREIDILRGLQGMYDLKNGFLVYPRKGYNPVQRCETSAQLDLVRRVTTFVDGFTPSDLSSTEIRRASRAES